MLIISLEDYQVYLKNNMAHNPHYKELKYHDLMLHRINEILLVSSPYDSFILEEDGNLSEQILHEFQGMNLSYAPRIWSENTAKNALELLNSRNFDLIIVMLRIADTDPISFSKNIKKSYPEVPIVLLAFDESEIKQLHDKHAKYIDDIFIWSGNSNIFPAIIKSYEDHKNIQRDIEIGDVRTILLIEDTPRNYSNLLPILYKEIIFHTKQLMDKSLNTEQRLLHMRARPKILLAKTYEEALNIYKKYNKNLLGIIADVRFPKKNKLEKYAGLEFAEYIRNNNESIPLLIQTSEQGLDLIDISKKYNLSALNKNSPNFFKKIKSFIKNNFGFGDFIIRDKNDIEIGRATNIDELIEKLHSIPEESIYFHASRNHFSNWLAARGELTLATEFRKIKLTDFKTQSDRRKHYISLIEKNPSFKHKKKNIIQFTKHSNLKFGNFIRIGSGSLGGKARGLAFANSFVDSELSKKEYPDSIVKIPKTIVISTDEFDRFMDINNLWDTALHSKTNKEILEIFLKGRLSREIIVIIKEVLKELKTPLAVRSSSLLEDSQYQPLAGMYSTFMLPNSSKNLKERLSQICEAIKRIYASTFFQGPKAIMDTIIHRHEEEKMAVIIMELVGQQHNDNFYPTFSGVAQSYNYYPVSYMNRKEGVVFIASGLGKTIADGEKSLRFSPYYPNILPQYYSIKSTIQNTQNNFYALALKNGENPMDSGEENNLKSFPLNIAENDGQLKYLASVLCSEDDIIRDSLKHEGQRIITGAPILKYDAFPLNDIIKDLLKSAENALGCPSEIEFAVNINEQNLMEFSLLQIKPMVIETLMNKKKTIDMKNDNRICYSSNVLGNGSINKIKHIVAVDLNTFDKSKTEDIVKEINILNEFLGEENPYLLIGPGRWGTSDSWLGIPVIWKQISNVKVIVELGIDDLNPDPSYGSHFFQNLTSMHIGYFTLTKNEYKKSINWDWVNKQSVVKEMKYVKVIQLKNELEIIIDGYSGEGVINHSISNDNELMDEELSTGI